MESLPSETAQDDFKDVRSAFYPDPVKTVRHLFRERLVVIGEELEARVAGETFRAKLFPDKGFVHEGPSGEVVGKNPQEFLTKLADAYGLERCGETLPHPRPSTNASVCAECMGLRGAPSGGQEIRKLSFESSGKPTRSTKEQWTSNMLYSTPTLQSTAQPSSQEEVHCFLCRTLEKDLRKTSFATPWSAWRRKTRFG